MATRQELVHWVEMLRAENITARQQRDAARAELAAAQQRLVEAGAEMRAQADELAAVRQQRDALREALETVEWIPHWYTERHCPQCLKQEVDGHDADCQLASALKVRNA